MEEFYLLISFSDWLLSPVVVVSINGDFLTSFLPLISWKRKKTKENESLV